MSMSKAMLTTMTGFYDRMHVHDAATAAGTVVIDTGPVRPTDFGLIRETQDIVFRSQLPAISAAAPWLVAHPAVAMNHRWGLGSHGRDLRPFSALTGIVQGFRCGAACGPADVPDTPRTWWRPDLRRRQPRGSGRAAPRPATEGSVISAVGWLIQAHLSCLPRCCIPPVHSLIDQSLHSRLGAETTNGDGFGVGWYDAGPAPGIFRSIEPAWNDENLRELAGHISSDLFFAHIRAAIGSAVQQTNCHPFRHGRWLFMPNGFIDGFAAVKRDLVLAVDEPLFPEIRGTADTEVLFCLALTFGLEDDPPGAVARAIGLVEACGRARGVEYPFQGTIATTDGESLWVFRYSSAGTSRSLFFTRDVRTLRQQYPDREIQQYPDREILREVSDDARLVVSEPIGDLPGAWAEMPEASYGVVSKGGDPLLPFNPKPPPGVRLRPDPGPWHGRLTLLARARPGLRDAPAACRPGR